MHRFVFMLHIFLLCVCVCVCYSRGLDLWGLWVNGWGWGVLQGLYSFVYRQVCLCICLFVHFCIFVFVYLCVCLTSEKMGEDMAPCTLPLRHKWRPRHCQALPSSHPPSPCQTCQTHKQTIDLQLLDPASPADQLFSQILFNCNRKLWKPQLQYGGSAWCPRWSICSRNIAIFGIYYHIILLLLTIWSI